MRRTPATLERERSWQPTAENDVSRRAGCKETAPRPPTGFPMRRLVLILVSAALALPALGAASPGPVTYSFGRTGGNIAPFTVTISASGAVSSAGPVTPKRTGVGPAARARLAGLVRTTRFYGLPHTTRCSGALPDFASNFVTIRSAGTARTVLVHGDCSKRFATLYDALSAAVGVPR